MIFRLQQGKRMLNHRKNRLSASKQAVFLLDGWECFP